jgi:hypothetical protein
MKFSIRDLFLVTVIVAVLVAWWLDKSRVALQREAAKRMMDDAEKNRRIADERFTQAKYYLQKEGYVVAEWGDGGVAFADPRNPGKNLPFPSASAPIPPRP